MVATHLCKNLMLHEVKQIVVCVSFVASEPWPDRVVVFSQVAARTETGVRRRTQAMSRSCSKRKSRFSSLWGLDTTSKKKTKAHPSINQVCEILQFFSSFAAINRTPWKKDFFSLYPQAFSSAGVTTTWPSFLSQQVFADGEEPAKKPVDGMYVDPTKEHTVRRNHSVCMHLTARCRSTRVGTFGN